MTGRAHLSAQPKRRRSASSKPGRTPRRPARTRIHFHVWDDQSSPQSASKSPISSSRRGSRRFSADDSGDLPCDPTVGRKERTADVLPEPSIHPASGSYAFSAGEDSADVAAVILRYLKGRGLTRIASLHATDASGADLARAFDAAFAMPEMRSLSQVAQERFNPTDVSVSAQIARIKAANPQALLTWTAGTPLGTVCAVRTMEFDHPDRHVGWQHEPRASPPVCVVSTPGVAVQRADRMDAGQRRPGTDTGCPARLRRRDQGRRLSADAVIRLPGIPRMPISTPFVSWVWERPPIKCGRISLGCVAGSGSTACTIPRRATTRPRSKRRASDGLGAKTGDFVAVSKRGGLQLR